MLCIHITSFFYKDLDNLCTYIGFSTPYIFHQHYLTGMITTAATTTTFLVVVSGNTTTSEVVVVGGSTNGSTSTTTATIPTNRLVQT